MYFTDRKSTKPISEMTEADFEESAARSKRRGLTEQEAAQPRGASSSAGLMKCWSTRQYITDQAKERRDEAKRADEEFDKRNKSLFGEKRAAEMRRERGFARDCEDGLASGREPMWRYVSGLFKNEEHNMDPNQRAAGIDYLLRSVEKILRVEMRHHESIQNAKCKMQNDSAESSVCRQTYMWDPLRAVCVQMQISQRKLTMFAKEQTGMSAPEMVDSIRAESVPERMKEHLKRFVAEWFAGRRNDSVSAAEKGQKGQNGQKGQKGQKIPLSPLSPLDPGSSLASEAEEIWGDLKALRRSPRWDRTAWAAGHGFSSYPKFFRACMLRYGRTPHQLELALLDEILAEADEIEKREASAAPANAADSNTDTIKEGGTSSPETESQPAEPEPRE